MALPLKFPVDEREVDLSAIRAQGAGGQNVNKVSSAVHLRFDIASSSLPDDIKARLLARQDSRITREGVLVLNESGAAIVQSCDGRPIDELVAALQTQFRDARLETDVPAFLERLFDKGLVFDAQH